MSQPLSGAPAILQGKRLNTLLLGACMLHRPVLWSEVGRANLDCLAYGRLNEVHTFGQMFQLLDVLRGDRTVPDALRPFARLTRVSLAAQADVLRNMQLVLVSPSSPIEMTYRDVYVNRDALRRLLAEPLEGDREAGLKLLYRWVIHGLQRLNDALRSELSTQLLSFYRSGTAEADLARSILRETRAHRGDIQADLRKMHGLFGTRIGVVQFYFRYMADGRALTWPSGFQEQLIAAARELGLPSFDPAPIVLNVGATEALRGDLIHYRPEFLPVIGRAVVDFAMRVRENAAG